METPSRKSWPISSPTLSREKRLSPRRAPKRSLLPLSPRRTQVRLTPLLLLVSGHRQICFRPRGRLSGQEFSAALLQDLTTQRTAALRAALSVRPDIALIAITEQTKDVRNLLPPKLRASLGLGARTVPERSLEGSGGGCCSHRQRCPEPARRRFYRQISCCRRLSSSTRFRHGQLVATHRRQLFRPHQEGPNSSSCPRSYRNSR
jgi:hypothetical protein